MKSQKSQIVDNKIKPMSFWDHTDELIRRLKKVFYILAASTIIMIAAPGNLSFFSNPIENYQPLISVILNTIRKQSLPDNVTLIGLQFATPVELYVVASFIFAFVVTIPILFYQIYRFLEPALHENEKKDIFPFFTSFSILLIIGLIFGYRILTPVIIRAMFPFFQAVGAELVISIMDFYIFLLQTTLFTGLFFTFPIFFVLLVKYGIIGTQIVTNNRRYIYAGLFIFTMLTTPDGGISNFILFIPIMILLEIGIIFGKRFEKEDNKRMIWFLNREITCKYCNTEYDKELVFCPKCSRAQK